MLIHYGNKSKIAAIIDENIKKPSSRILY